MARYGAGRGKYGNIKTVVDGHKFDSRKEADRYLELKLLQRAGEIQELQLQPTFVLQDKMCIAGQSIRAITYKADFQYRVGDVIFVEDVKASVGMRTKEYLLKKKLFLCKYHNEYTLVEYI